MFFSIAIERVVVSVRQGSESMYGKWYAVDSGY